MEKELRYEKSTTLIQHIRICVKIVNAMRTRTAALFLCLRALSVFSETCKDAHTSIENLRDNVCVGEKKEPNKGWEMIDHLSDEDILATECDNDPCEEKDCCQEGPKRTVTPTGARPNILFFMLDQWRYDWDGSKQRKRKRIPLKVPFLDELAASGVRFEQAYVPAPICGPSRACFALGQEFDTTKVWDNRAQLTPSSDNIYKILRNQGNYHTMTTGKTHLCKQCDYYDKTSTLYHEFGFNDWIETPGKQSLAEGLDCWGEVDRSEYVKFLTNYKKTIHYKGSNRIVSGLDIITDCSKGNSSFSSACKAKTFTKDMFIDNFVGNTSIELLKRKTHGMPWFLQVNMPGPHAPTYTTAEMAQSVLGRDWPKPFGTELVSEKRLKRVYGGDLEHFVCPQQKLVDSGMSAEKIGPTVTPVLSVCNYGASIENIDSIMMDIVEYVSKINEKENTIICVTGDHGEMLGDFGFKAKGKPWQASVSVPLVCSGPGIRKNTTYKKPVGTLDLTATFLDYAGLSRYSNSMASKSLRPILEGTISTNPLGRKKNFISSGNKNWRMVVGNIRGSTFKLICCKGPCTRRSDIRSKEGIVGKWRYLLFNLQKDPMETSPLQNRKRMVQKILRHLPDGWCNFTIWKGKQK